MGRFYVVGGAVRDRLLGVRCHDVDVVAVGFGLAEMKKLFGEPVGRDFPVFIGVVPGLEGFGKVEVAMARKEISTGQGYRDFEVQFGPDVTLEEDLARRDFTINAMAMNPATGELVDPYGGAEDLRAGILRAVRLDCFREDPVRVLRLARFAARFPSFSIEKETFRAAREVAASMLRHATPERVAGEMRKALRGARPSRFFEVLRDLEALGIWFPEVAGLLGIPQNHHEEDAFEHTLLVVDEARARTEDEALVFAALVHDLGKGETPKEVLPAHHGHDKRVGGVVSLWERLRLPVRFKRVALAFARAHMRLHRAHEMRPAKLFRLMEGLKQAGLGVREVTLLMEADASGRRPSKSSAEAAEAIRLAEAVLERVTGRALVKAGVKAQGKAFGEVLLQRRVEEFKRVRGRV